jgi:hypothetical protein
VIGFEDEAQINILARVSHATEKLTFLSPKVPFNLDKISVPFCPSLGNEK